MSTGPAYDLIANLLRQYGLDHLADWAYAQLTEGRSPDEVQIGLRERPEFRQRFRGIFDREDKGLPAMSVDEYLSWEKQASALMHTYGMPAGFYDEPEDFADMIGADVSPVELEQRLNMYADAATHAPAEVRDALADMYGVGEGGLAAYYADPDRGLQVLQSQFQAAKVAGAARRQSFGALTAEEAERLASTGLDEAGATEQFGLLSTLAEAVNALPGESAAGLDRETLLGAVSGDAQARERVKMRTQTRLATFAGGGAYATGQGGVGGSGPPPGSARFDKYARSPILTFDRIGPLVSCPAGRPEGELYGDNTRTGSRHYVRMARPV